MSLESPQPIQPPEGWTWLEHEYLESEQEIDSYRVLTMCKPHCM